MYEGHNGACSKVAVSVPGLEYYIHGVNTQLGHQSVLEDNVCHVYTHEGPVPQVPSLHYVTETDSSLWNNWKEMSYCDLVSPRPQECELVSPDPYVYGTGETSSHSYLCLDLFVRTTHVDMCVQFLYRKPNYFWRGEINNSGLHRHSK